VLYPLTQYNIYLSIVNAKAQYMETRPML
jgi:hypothetical protein